MPKTMMKYHVSCAEISGGECTWSADSDSKRELLTRIKRHARNQHGMTNKDFDSAFLAQVDAAISTN